MSLFSLASIVITLVTLLSFVNYKIFRLPSSIGLLMIAMIVSGIGILLKQLNIINDFYINQFLLGINFDETVFHGMLSFLLFAGALQINIEDLKKTKWAVLLTAVVSTALSTLMISALFYILCHFFGYNLPYIYAFLFGTIVSPTDPIAVSSIIKKSTMSKRLKTTIIGESLFNDGFAIVLFLLTIEVIRGFDVSPLHVGHLLLLEVVGGLLFGIVIGWIAYQMLQRVQEQQIELFITLSIATGGYALAEQMHVSAPLAMVVAGIIIGNRGRSYAMSDRSRHFIDTFWEAIDEILNTILFFLIGLEMMVLNVSIKIILLGFSCIVIALLSRFLSLALPAWIMAKFYPVKLKTIALLTWAGLRGALSIAMVLTLSANHLKDLFLPCVYCIVIFSIMVQGLSLSKSKLFDMWGK